MFLTCYPADISPMLRYAILDGWYVTVVLYDSCNEGKVLLLQK